MAGENIRQQQITVCGILAFYNESENLTPLVTELFSVFEGRPEKLRLILVDDGSSDGSYDTALTLQQEFPTITIVRFSRNFGHHKALLAGIKRAQGDLFFLMDADNQDSPQSVLQLIDARPNGSEIVYAIRVQRVEPFKRRLTAKIYWGIVNLMTHHYCEPDQAVMRVFTPVVRDTLATVNEYNPFLAGLFAWTGFPYTTIEVPHRERLYGTTKYNWTKLITSTIGSLLSFTNRPLRLILGLGFVISLLSLLFGLMLIVYYFVVGRFAPGWLSVVVGILFSLGLQLSAIALVGEYVGSIFEHTGGRPSVVIREVREGKDP